MKIGAPLHGARQNHSADAAVQHNVLHNVHQPPSFPTLGMRLFQSLPTSLPCKPVRAGCPSCMRDFRGIGCLIDHNAVCDVVTSLPDWHAHTSGCADNSTVHAFATARVTRIATDCVSLNRTGQRSSSSAAIGRTENLHARKPQERDINTIMRARRAPTMPAVHWNNI